MVEAGLRCFVAMAVGRADIDRVYDRLIRPTVRGLNITAVFMGQLEHNDDIDDRIIRELKICDFAIADLTYARPSVYFEAGFAQRTVPVIYTCRRDHLRPQKSDEFDNLRVHFDLQMRNIIPWRDLDDVIFRKRLKRRIVLVAKPLFRQRKAKAIADLEEKKFRRLSLDERVECIRDVFSTAISRLGYRSLIRRREADYWAGCAISGRVLHLAPVLVRLRFSVNEIQEAVKFSRLLAASRFERVEEGDEYEWDRTWGGHTRPQLAKLMRVRRIVIRLFLCSLDKIPLRTVARALPSYRPSDEPGAYVGATIVAIAPLQRRARRRGPPSVRELVSRPSVSLPTSVLVHVLSEIRSKPMARDMGSSLLRISRLKDLAASGMQWNSNPV